MQRLIGNIVFTLGLTLSIVAGATCYRNVSQKCSTLLDGVLVPVPDFVGVPCAQSNAPGGRCADVPISDPVIVHSEITPDGVWGKSKIVQPSLECTASWQNWACTPAGACANTNADSQDIGYHNPVDQGSAGCKREPGGGGGGMN